jgi:acetyl-CoA C-acetyltransferase
MKIVRKDRSRDEEVVVISAVRTAIGSIGGTLKDVPPEELMKTALAGL